MSTILSLIVCIAMLLSPATALPEYPETGTTWTIHNLSLDFGEESITLPQELEITAGIGTEEAQLHFQINDGETVYMPMTGALTADGVRFNLGNSDRTYTLSQETLMEMIGMTAEDAETLEIVEGVVLSYTKLLTAVVDPDFFAQYNEQLMNLLAIALNTESKETTVEVEGEMIPAVQISGEMTVNSALKFMDTVLECGIPEFEELGAVVLNVVNATMEEPIAGFSVFVDPANAELNEAAGMQMDFIVADGDPAYTHTEIAFDMDGVTMNWVSDSIVKGEEGSVVIAMEMDDGGTKMSYFIDQTYTGLITAPVASNMNATVSVNTQSSYELGEGETIVMEDDTTMNITMEMKNENGLETSTTHTETTVNSSYGSGDNIEHSSISYAMTMLYTDHLKEDGSITRSYVYNLEDDEAPATVSFDINRAQGALTDYFADTEEMPLPMNTEDEAYSMLMADGMLIAAGGMQLAADENVMALAELFTAEETYEEPADDVAEDAAEPVPAEESDAEEKYPAIKRVAPPTIEEVAHKFNGTVPAFTAPEGFELYEVSVEEDWLSATYHSEETYLSLDLHKYDWATDDDDYRYSYYELNDNSIEAIDGKIVEVTTHESEYGGFMTAELEVDGTNVDIMLGCSDIELMESVLAGLKF